MTTRPRELDLSLEDLTGDVRAVAGANGWTAWDLAVGMIGIERYGPGDWNRLDRPGRDVPILQGTNAPPDARTERAFETLDSILRDGDVQPFAAMDVALARDLGQLAERSRRFPAAINAMNGCMGPGGTLPGRLDLRERERTDRCMFLIRAAAWLPDYALEPIAHDLLRAIQSLDQLYSMEEAYVRLADFVEGPSDPLFDHYAHLSANNGLNGRYAIMGLCRIGRAPDEVRDRLKRDLIIQDPGGSHPSKSKDEFRRRALFLALVALDEREFVQRKVQSLPPTGREWYERVLQGEAMGPHGPNNCIPYFGNDEGWAPASLTEVIET